jgi:hypothetical protein
VAQHVRMDRELEFRSRAISHGTGEIFGEQRVELSRRRQLIGGRASSTLSDYLKRVRSKCQ